jgi:hypothetical protein
MVIDYPVNDRAARGAATAAALQESARLDVRGGEDTRASLRGQDARAGERHGAGLRRPAAFTWYGREVAW